MMTIRFSPGNTKMNNDIRKRWDYTFSKAKCQDKECWEGAKYENKSHLCTPESPCWIDKS